MSKNRVRFEGSGVLRNEARSGPVVEGRSSDRGCRDELRFEANFGEGAVGRGHFDRDRFWLGDRGRPILLVLLECFEGSLIATLGGSDIALGPAKDSVIAVVEEARGEQMIGVCIHDFGAVVEDFEDIRHDEGGDSGFDATGTIQAPERFGELVGQNVFFGGHREIGRMGFGTELVEVGLKLSG